MKFERVPKPPAKVESYGSAERPTVPVLPHRTFVYLANCGLSFPTKRWRLKKKSVLKKLLISEACTKNESDKLNTILKEPIVPFRLLSPTPTEKTQVFCDLQLRSDI